MILITFLIGMLIAFVLFGYIPLFLVVQHRDNIRLARRRPIDEVLKDALAEGRISDAQFSTMMDEVHKSMPTIDAPYPLVREWMEYKP